jgi:hypothetical protein
MVVPRAFCEWEVVWVWGVIGGPVRCRLGASASWLALGSPPRALPPTVATPSVRPGPPTAGLPCEPRPRTTAVVVPRSGTRMPSYPPLPPRAWYTPPTPPTAAVFFITATAAHEMWALANNVLAACL